MDISKEHINMCDKAGEIQELDPSSEEGNYYVDVDGDVCVWSGYSQWDYPGIPNKRIWLPRQDQLQDMIDWSPFSYKVSTICYQIDDFYKNLDDSWMPESMEQLWLAFVMREKFNKQWDGNQWEVCK